MVGIQWETTWNSMGNNLQSCLCGFVNGSGLLPRLAPSIGSIRARAFPWKSWSRVELELVQQAWPVPGHPKHILQVILSTRIKDACIAIRHSQGYIISILQGLGMGWKGLTTRLRGPKIMKKGTQIIKKGV